MIKEIKDQNINLRVSLSLKTKMETEAEKENLTLSKYLLKVIEKSVEPKKVPIKPKLEEPNLVTQTPNFLDVLKTLGQVLVPVFILTIILLLFKQKPNNYVYSENT
jgi:hypothetical protein